MRSADMPGPGSRFGQEVTMRHFSVSARAIGRRGESAGGGGTE